MEIFDNHYHFFAENAVIPIYDMAKNTRRLQHKKYLEKTQWLKPEEILIYQKKLLKKLLIESNENVPYYNSLFKENNIDLSNADPFEIISKIPVLTKDNIQQYSNELVSQSFNVNQLIPYKSGGSTGNQLRFYQSNDQLSWELGAELRSFDWADYHFGDKCLMFWGSHIDMNRVGSLFKNFLKKMERVYIADTYVMSDKKIQEYIDLINYFKPKIIRSYTSSIYMISEYARKNGLNVHSPKSIITSAESLHAEMRESIEQTFNASVFDYYGSREVSPISAECEKHEGYHIISENVYLEIMKDGELMSPGEEGSLLITNLRNNAMPFIRYKIGDVATFTDHVCSCGRGLPLMSAIEGRESDYLALLDKESGKISRLGPLYPVIITALMEVPVKHCLMIQEDYYKIVYQIVKEKEYTESDSEFLIEYFKKFFGDEFEIEIEFKDEIPPLASGKRSAFISKINHF